MADRRAHTEAAPGSRERPENGKRTPEEFDRFHDLTKRLLQVPKKAISEAEKRAKKGR